MGSDTIKIDGKKYEVQYTYHRGSRGYSEGGVPMEPDDPSGYEIESCTLEDDDEEVPEGFIEKHYNKIVNQLGGD